ncbi:hypothetical protein RI129_006316 [Pyrocoelia pectoralis]|uniref:Major facilitator superfamily (MFS) profile domain-containing protein n=1 Tax=Pyrocoelia pectoralis TaxID=417401 RepID=A0AAN7VH05_9COLE
MEQCRECEGLFAGELHNEQFSESTQAGNSTVENKNKWTPLLVLVATSVTIGLYVPVGYNIGVVNSPAEIIKKFCNESIYERYDRSLTDGQLRILWSSVVSIFLVGGTIGSLTGSWLADYVGRKGASIVSGGLTTCIVPMYLIELAPTYLTGAMGVFCQLGITLGILIAQVLSLNQILGDEELWPYLLSSYAVFIIMCSITIPVLPESPKFLLFNKKRDEAFKQLERIRNNPNYVVEREIMEMESHMQVVSEQTQTGWNIGKVLRDRSLLLPIILVCSMQAGQQFSGINAVFYYSTLIFKAAGLSDQESQFATIGSGVINLLMGCASVVIISFFKRRGVMQLSCLLSILCLLLLSLTIIYMESYTWIPYICIIAVLGFVLCYGIGLGPIPYFIGSELFEVGPRPSAMALGGIANYGGNFIIGLTFPLMQAEIGAASFIVFAGFTTALLFLMRFYLPETKGRDPSEVAVLCKNGLRSRVLVSPIDSTITADTVSTPEVKVS